MAQNINLFTYLLTYLLLCSENFENRGQLPVSQVLEGTDD